MTPTEVHVRSTMYTAILGYVASLCHGVNAAVYWKFGQDGALAGIWLAGCIAWGPSAIINTSSWRFQQKWRNDDYMAQVASKVNHIKVHRQ